MDISHIKGGALALRSSVLVTAAEGGWCFSWPEAQIGCTIKIQGAPNDCLLENVTHRLSHYDHRRDLVNIMGCYAGLKLPVLNQTFYYPIKWILMNAVFAFDFYFWIDLTGHQSSPGWSPRSYKPLLCMLTFVRCELFSGFCFLAVTQPEPTKQPDPRSHHASLTAVPSQLDLGHGAFLATLQNETTSERCCSYRTPPPITPDSYHPPAPHLFVKWEN